jgi:hypothetical protein
MISEAFLRAGKALLTVTVPPGERFIFRVKHKPAESDFPDTYRLSGKKSV